MLDDWCSALFADTDSPRDKEKKTLYHFQLPFELILETMLEEKFEFSEISEKSVQDRSEIKIS